MQQLSYFVGHIALHLRHETGSDVLVFAHALHVAAQSVDFGDAFVEIAAH